MYISEEKEVTKYGGTHIIKVPKKFLGTRLYVVDEEALGLIMKRSKK